MIRPHPTVWKFMHGCCMLYLIAMVYILIQGKTEARAMLKVRIQTVGAGSALIEVACIKRHALTAQLTCKQRHLQPCIKHRSPIKLPRATAHGAA